MLLAKALRKSAPRREFRAPPTFQRLSSSKSGRPSRITEELELEEDCVSSIEELVFSSSFEELVPSSSVERGSLLSSNEDSSEFDGTVSLFSGEESKRESEEEVFPGATHDPRNKGSAKRR